MLNDIETVALTYTAKFELRQKFGKYEITKNKQNRNAIEYVIKSALRHFRDVRVRVTKFVNLCLAYKKYTEDETLHNSITLDTG